MSFPRLIPILLLEDNRLIKTRGFDKPSYIGDILNAIRIFNEKEVDELIILDISSKRKDFLINFELLKNLAGECFMPVTYGGGISSVDDAARILDCGIEKVSINSAIFNNLSLAQNISNKIGSSSTVLSVDILSDGTNYSIYNQPKIDLLDFISNAESLGFGEILIQDVYRDGELIGPNLHLISTVHKSTRLPIIYAGGVSDLEGCASAWRSGASGVGAGAWFVYKGTHRAVMISYPKYTNIQEVFLKCLANKNND